MCVANAYYVIELKMTYLMLFKFFKFFQIQSALRYHFRTSIGLN